MAMVTATITSKGQITIPRSVRESLHLHSGDRVGFIMNGVNEAVLRPITRSVDQVFGRLHKHGQVSRTVEEMNQTIDQRMRGK